jgi:hypothetical protein
VILKAFSFARMLRDACSLAGARRSRVEAEFGEPAGFVVGLTEAVRAHLKELASERVEF